MAKRALLVGCNYPGSSAELKGCINDVHTMKSLLTSTLGFSESDITVMIDTDKSFPQPTGAAIKAKLTELVSASKDGDVLFFHFSGHGTQVPAGDNVEVDGKDEAICPTDMNVILDDDLRRIFAPFPKGGKLTMVADCCHSGTMLDHQEVQITGNKDGSADLPDMGNLGTIAGLFGIKNMPGEIKVAEVGEQGEFKNRSLPVDKLADMLSSILGKAIKSNEIQRGLGEAFGPNASAMAQTAMKFLQNYAAGKTKLPMGETSNAASSKKGVLDVVVRMLGALCSSKPNVSNAAAGHPNAAAGHPTPSAGGEPNLPVQMPTGPKPGQPVHLADDIGILITGCRDKETSADACPSGDPKKAYGALTNSINVIITEHQKRNPGKHITYMELVQGVRQLLQKGGFSQNPCLECSQKYAHEPYVVLV